MDAVDYQRSSSEVAPCTDTSEYSFTAHNDSGTGGDGGDLCKSKAEDPVPVAALACAGSVSQEETSMKKLLSKLKRSDGC